MKKYVCPCGYEYDPKLVEPSQGIAPGTPWEEVADAWAERLNGIGVEFDVVPPAMRTLLAERGVEILPPHKGMGKDCNDAYNEWKENFINDYLPGKSPNPYGDRTNWAVVFQTGKR